MKALMIIIKNSKYLLNIDNIDRIIQKESPTPIPDAPTYVDGVIDFNDEALKIINMRSLLGQETFAEEKKEMINRIRKGHDAWFDSLIESVTERTPFTKTLNPHKCELGQTIDELLTCLKCGRDFIHLIEKVLKTPHDKFHACGATVLGVDDQKRALDLIHTDTLNVKNKVFDGIRILEDNIEQLTASTERIIIFNIKGSIVGLRVDRVSKIVEFDEADFTLVKSSERVNNKVIIEKSIIIDNEIILFAEFNEDLV